MKVSRPLPLVLNGLLILTALAWLEYCNSKHDSYYANMRRRNGREKPYNVKYWALVRSNLTLFDELF